MSAHSVCVIYCMTESHFIGDITNLHIIDRSVIFYHSEEQKQIAEKVTKEVQEKHYPEQTIVTLIVPATKFWDAEEYHQLYLEKNPGKCRIQAIELIVEGSCC